jgi:SHS2 domain-containing protein
MQNRWDPGKRDEAYVELEHPSDLFLEIRGRDLGELFENALFAFYQQVARIEELRARHELTLSVHELRLDEALRSVLAEALYHFDTEGFVATGAQVRIETEGAGMPSAAGERTYSSAGAGFGNGASPPTSPASPDGGWWITARLWGDHTGREHHSLVREIKAVTYHRLEVRESSDGWTATVLLDI